MAHYSTLVQRITAAAEAGRIRSAKVRATLRDAVARHNRRGTLTNDQAVLLNTIITSFMRAGASRRAPARSGTVRRKTKARSTTARRR